MHTGRSTSNALQRFRATPESVGQRLDQFLTAALANVSRARVQVLIEQHKVQVNGSVARPSLKLRGDELIEVLGEAERPPLKATPEDIPLDVVYEDEYLAVVNKQAGMIVHAGAGDEERNRGTLVNALLFRFQKLSELGGEARPGIVHRLDKETSGLMVVAKADDVHRKLAAQFASRQVKKRYIALVGGWPAEKGTIAAEVSRDRLRPTRMTTRREGGRTAVSHFVVRRKLETRYGKFALLDVDIETGRTHQIRVHLSSVHHPVVGDTLYGAPRVLQEQATLRRGKRENLNKNEQLSLARNFLHAAMLEFVHPVTHQRLHFERVLPGELQNFLRKLELKDS
ncbi:MAG: RluA family pseudouridine synthase [Acidobacteria bacterium]|nr:MAG: RluA family pseudouridine synthase [Acidobacteriota bacterium]